MLFCWSGNGLSDAHTIPSSAVSPSTSGFASALVRSGLWGHCGFDITNERATRKNSMLKTFSQYLTIHEENRSRCFPFQL